MRVRIRGAGLLAEHLTSGSPATRPSNSPERATGNVHTLSDAGRALGIVSPSFAATTVESYGLCAPRTNDSAPQTETSTHSGRQQPLHRGCALGNASLNWDRQRKLPLEAEDTRLLKRSSESDADRPGVISQKSLYGRISVRSTSLPNVIGNPEEKGKSVDVFECWFDGACEPINPGGTASYGIVIEKDGELVKEAHGIVGSGEAMSNNVAEYAAVTEIFGFLLALEASGEVVIRGDSRLVIEQLSGRWKAKQGRYFPFYLGAKEALRLLKQSCDVSFEWIPREQNERCDALSKAHVATP